MIEIRHVTKCFDSIKALNDVTFTIPKGRIFGLLGTNGAGKSTLLRAMAGILACDAGEILIEGEACYDNPQGKERFFYLPDDPYYFPNATMETMTDLPQAIPGHGTGSCGVHGRAAGTGRPKAFAHIFQRNEETGVLDSCLVCEYGLPAVRRSV